MTSPQRAATCYGAGLFPCAFLILIFFQVLAFADDSGFRNSLGMEFVLVPAGGFVMGSPPGEAYRDGGETQHRVIISKPFYMQATEVTLKQWRSIMGRGFFSRRGEDEKAPVLRVSWFDCLDFIKKLNAENQGRYRLPTEAEWEYACRAGTVTAYSWGDRLDCSRARFGGADECEEYLNSRDLPKGGPAPVRSYPPNPWGLYDMHGNVWEWCGDWFGEYPPGPVIDPSGPESGDMKVRRGGSWFGTGFSCRSANRAYAHPASRFKTTGFRLVREP